MDADLLVVQVAIETTCQDHLSDLGDVVSRRVRCRRSCVLFKGCYIQVRWYRRHSCVVVLARDGWKQTCTLAVELS